MVTVEYILGLHLQTSIHCFENVLFCLFGHLAAVTDKIPQNQMDMKMHGSVLLD